jgi:hypothetical protein
MIKKALLMSKQCLLTRPGAQALGLFLFPQVFWYLRRNGPLDSKPHKFDLPPSWRDQPQKGKGEGRSPLLCRRGESNVTMFGCDGRHYVEILRMISL